VIFSSFILFDPFHFLTRKKEDFSMAQEHTFATPAPAGLGALAVACFGFAAVFLGWVKAEGLPILFAWLVGGGVVQYTVAVMELKDHNITGGNVFLFFSAFFMFGASLSVLAKFLMIKFGMAPHVYVEGWTWMAGAGFLTAVTPAYLKANKLIFLLVIMIDIVLWCIVGLDLGKMDPAVGKPIVGWLLVASGWIGVYVAGAVVCNTVFGRVIYPIPAPFVK
jgi:succinate-acetate transporter protein